jgi:predicted transcriptional regulator
MTGQEFKTIRERLGLTQYDLYVALGHDKAPSTGTPYISRLEAGVRPVPRVMRNLMLAFKRLGTVPEEMFER